MKRFLLAVLVVGLCLCSLLWGAVAVRSGLFPGTQLRSAYKGGKALLKYMRMRSEHDSPDMWHEDRYGVRGLVRHVAAQAYNGYTLYTSCHAQRAFLLSMAGTIVHEWHLPYDRIWEPGCPVKSTRPDHLVFWRKALVFPNGDLLAIVIGAGDTPWGLGLIKVDRDSNLIWKFLEPVHHDVEIGDDGRIYTLTHRIATEPVAGAPNIRPPYLDDYLVVLSAEGVKLDQLRLLEALRDSDMRYVIDLAPKSALGEYLHANSVEVIPPRLAPRCSFAAAGRVLVSLPQLHALVAVDLAQRNAVWAMVGPWTFQHDPDLLENGNILIFDNYGHMGPGGVSRVIEVDPRDAGIEWAFHGDAGRVFGSPTRSAQQRLPNGNTLITESDYGRILEVTREGAVVWEYVNPVRSGADDRLIAKVCWASRVAPDELDAAFLASLRANEAAHEGELQ